MSDTLPENHHRGLVVSRFGNTADIENKDGEVARCHIRRQLSDLVCGDRVIWESTPQDESKAGVVISIEPRTGVLQRHIRYEGLKPVASHLDQVCVVTAPEPVFSARVLDKYLIAIECAGIDAIIFVNKSDRLVDYPELEGELKRYQDLGYRVEIISAKQKVGMDNLNEILKDKTSVFVGQSGVGKSSLVNALLPELELETSELSETSGLGTHTTTVSRLYHLPQGGSLIDSPGIREFTLGHIEIEDLMEGFRELQDLQGKCKFRDCQHVTEPRCAVREAVESGTFHAERYASYLAVREEILSED